MSALAHLLNPPPIPKREGRKVLPLGMGEIVESNKSGIHRGPKKVIDEPADDIAVLVVVVTGASRIPEMRKVLWRLPQKRIEEALRRLRKAGKVSFSRVGHANIWSAI